MADYDMEILGQKLMYPKTKESASTVVLVVLIICASIVLMAYILDEEKIGALQKVWLGKEIDLARDDYISSLEIGVERLEGSILKVRSALDKASPSIKETIDIPPIIFKWNREGIDKKKTKYMEIKSISPSYWDQVRGDLVKSKGGYDPNDD